MFEDVEDARVALERAQSAANRHGITFYLVANILLPNSEKSSIRITSVPTPCHLEKVSPANIPLT